MSMGYVSVAWIDSIPHIRALPHAIIAFHGKWVWTHERGITCCSVCQCLNHPKAVILWLFNCLIALETKCHLCKGSDFKVIHCSREVLDEWRATESSLGELCSLLVNLLSLLS